MVIVKMAGGDVEYIDAKELLWMREAFDSEFRGAVMLRLSSDRLYPIESLAELSDKFQNAGAIIARFTPPVGTVAMLVSAERVREVEPSNRAIYHEAAQSVLKFGPRLKLAVQESVGEAKDATRFGLDVELRVSLPGVEHEDADKLANMAHAEICPYSRATRGNLDVRVKVES